MFTAAARTASNIRHHLNSSSMLSRSAIAAMALAATPVSPSYALPGDGELVAGSAEWVYHLNQLIITQGSFAAINWLGGFNLSPGQLVEIIGPQGFISLNRDTSGQLSQIFGNINAHGGLFILINPNGVVIGNGANINVGSLVVSSADISNADAAAGNFNFNIAGNADAAIINQGLITAEQGGLVALVGPRVANSGVIQADLGTVIMGGAQTFTLDMNGDGLYSIALGEASTITSGNVVENSGTISADGGKVLLTARAASETLDAVINQTGIISATSVENRNGVIILDGGSNGTVHVGGTLDASGKGAGQTGGTVQITGQHIELIGATIDASGNAGGGQVNIGGGLQGTGDLAHADTVYVDSNSVIDVSALETGNGGTAIIWSDEQTDFYGMVKGTGGVNGGNGGFAEVSSAGYLNFYGNADLHAFNGEAGTLLLDPTNITINALQALILSGILTGGTDVILQTSGAGGQAGDIIINAIIASLGSGDLTLNAHGDIIVNAAITLLFGNATFNANFDNNAFGGNITFNNAALTVGGNAILNAINVALNGASGINAGGFIDINNTGTFHSDNADTLNALGTISLNQSAAGSINNAIEAIGLHGGLASLQLGEGVWNENVVIDDAYNFLLNGASTGVGSTINTQSDGPGISITDSLGVTINGMIIDGNDKTGIIVGNSALITLSNNTLFDVRSGIVGNGVVGLDIHGNSIDDARGDGINLNNVSLFDIYNNTITNIGRNGIAIFDSELGLIDSNTIDTAQTGVLLMNSNGIVVSNNDIDNTHIAIDIQGGNGIAALGNDIYEADIGINANGVSDLLIAGNSIDHSFPAPGTIGINVFNSDGVIIVDNDLQHLNHGIVVEDTINASIIGNWFRYISATAITMKNSDSSFISLNDIDMTRTGIQLHNSDDAEVIANLINAGKYGIMSINSNGGLFALNLINADLFDGIYVQGGDNNHITNNIITAGRDGVSLLATDNTEIDYNIIFGGNTGVLVTDSSDISIHDNVIGSDNDAIGVYGSTDFTINHNVLAALRNGITISGSSFGDIYHNVIGAGNDGVSAEDSNNLDFWNNAIFAGHNGFSLTNSNTINIEDNLITAEEDGVNAENVSYVDIDGNIIVAGHDGVHLVNGQWVRIDSNIIGAGHNGIDIANSGNGDEEELGAPLDYNIEITNNVIGAINDGIHIENSSSVGIGYNVILAGDDGIDIDGSSEILAVGNVIGAGNNGVEITDSSSMLFQNNIVVAGNDGFHVNSAYGIAIIENAIVAHDDGIDLENVFDTYAIGNAILADDNGVEIDNSSFTYVQENAIGAGNDGVHIEDSNNVYVLSNAIAALNDGVFISNGHSIDVINNGILAGHNGVTVLNSYGDIEDLGEGGETYNINIIGNDILAANDGVHIEDSSSVLVDNNNIHAGNDGVFAGSNGYDYPSLLGDGYGYGTFNITVSNNDIEAGRDGVRFEGVSFSQVLNNNINANEVGVNILASGDGYDCGYDCDELSGGGMYVQSHDILVDGNDINANIGINVEEAYNIVASNNHIHASWIGINAWNSDNVTSVNNQIHGGTYGIVYSDVSNGFITNNELLAYGDDEEKVGSGGYIGIQVNGNAGDNTTHVEGNTVEGYYTGLEVNGTDGVDISGNTFNDNFIGALLNQSDNSTFENNVYNNNVFGVILNDSDNVELTGDVFNIPDFGVGLAVTNGSFNTLGGSLVFNIGDGGTGIYIGDNFSLGDDKGGKGPYLLGDGGFEGPGSTFQFSDGNSFFSGTVPGSNYWYFVLTSGAMAGLTLDASQQFYDIDENGIFVRGTDFTLEQLNKAEGRNDNDGSGRTRDGEDNEDPQFSVTGDVFYKEFPAFTLNLLLEEDRREEYDADKFSVAGFTILNTLTSAGTVREANNLVFKPREAQLSLLSPSTSGISGTQTITLASNIKPGDFGNLAPAAGGNAAALGQLSPAAGDVGNTFLDSGWQQ